MKRGRGGYNPFFNRGGGVFTKKMGKPVFTMQNSSRMDADSDFENAVKPGTTYSAEHEPGTYVGWKLYFPDKCECSIESAQKNVTDNNQTSSFQRVSRYRSPDQGNASAFRLLQQLVPVRHTTDMHSPTALAKSEGRQGSRRCLAGI